MNLKLPQEVLDILQQLHTAAYPTYIVGGCIRDLLRGRTPNDWDIATAASPEAVMSLFPHTVPTGLAHGTVTVVLETGQYEVTTFRVDGSYTNHRAPDTVTFTEDILEDLSRRDFTINAMAYHPHRGLLDPFGGVEDLKQGLIRCVGDPMKRFDEDALRMLRAVRFCAQTGFQIHEAILSAVRELAHLIASVSAERIRDELSKILVSDRPDALLILKETGLLSLILPELERCFETRQNTVYHVHDVGQHTMEVLRHTEARPVLRLAALLHDLGKPDKKTTDEQGIDHFKGHDLRSVVLAETILNRLRYDNQTKKQVLELIRLHDKPIEASKAGVRRFLSAMDKALFPSLMLLKRADAYGQNPVFLEERLAHYDRVEALCQMVYAEGNPLSVGELAITGHDLTELGYRGQTVGNLLKEALALVLEFPEKNQKETLLSHISALKDHEKTY